MIFAAILSMFFASVQIDLSGEWKLSGTSETGDVIKCDAVVPGDVHSALFKANLIENPFWGCNETNVQWVGRRDWTISRTFEVDETFLRAPSVILRMEDVDTFAIVLVNGKAVGETSNRFRRWEFDVKPYLKAGRNTIEGRFRSSWHVADVQPQYYEKHFPASTSGVVYSIN
jgi:beta-mannosidase